MQDNDLTPAEYELKVEKEKRPGRDVAASHRCLTIKEMGEYLGPRGIDQELGNDGWNSLAVVMGANILGPA
jgi:hypothetical protein